MYNTNETFRQKFDELYYTYKEELLKSTVLDTAVVDLDDSEEADEEDGISDLNALLQNDNKIKQ